MRHTAPVGLDVSPTLPSAQRTSSHRSRPHSQRAVEEASAASVRIAAARASTDCTDAPGFIANVSLNKRVVTLDQQPWAGSNWTCADFRGYMCAVGGWGLQSNHTDGRRLKDACPTSCLDGRCSTVTPLPSPKTVFVFGLESSGTRFVSRAIARALNPNTLWDGQGGPCWWWRGHRIVHVSLPMFGICGPEEVDMHRDWPTVVSDADLCYEPSTDLRRSAPRWIANITSTVLRAGRAARAIVVTRSHIFQRVSKLNTHGCGAFSGSLYARATNDASAHFRSQLAWRKEDALSRQLIIEALTHRRVGDQMLHVAYDELGWLAELHWGRIATHIGLTPAAFSPPPRFHSGDSRWIDAKWLPDLMRVAGEPSATWNGTAALAAIERVPKASGGGGGSGGSSSRSETAPRTGRQAAGVAAHMDAKSALRAAWSLLATKPASSYSTNWSEWHAWYAHHEEGIDGVSLARAEAKAIGEEASQRLSRHVVQRLERYCDGQPLETCSANLDGLQEQLETLQAHIDRLRLELDASNSRGSTWLHALVLTLVIGLCPAPATRRALRAFRRRALSLTMLVPPSSKASTDLTATRVEAARLLELTLGDGTSGVNLGVPLVTVLSVGPHSMLAQAGVERGDVLLCVGSQELSHGQAHAQRTLEEHVVAAWAAPTVAGGAADSESACARPLTLGIFLGKAQMVRQAAAEVERDEGPLWLWIWRWVYHLDCKQLAHTCADFASLGRRLRARCCGRACCADTMGAEAGLGALGTTTTKSE